MPQNERDPKRQKLSPANDQAIPTTASTSVPKDQIASSSRSSWYGSTWPRKAAPVTQVARESIESASNAAVETASIFKDKVINGSASSRKSSLALTLGHTASFKSQPLEAVSTNDHATPQGKASSAASVARPADRVIEQEPGPNPGPSISTQPEASMQESGDGQDVRSEASIPKDTAPRSWIGWLAGGDGTPTQKSEPTSQVKKEDAVQAQKEPEVTESTEENIPTPQQNESESDGKSTVETQRRSWLPIWNNAAASQSAPAIASATNDTKHQSQSTNSAQPVEEITPKSAKDDARSSDVEQAGDPDKAQVQTSNRNSGWSFWSRERNLETGSTKSAPEENEPVPKETAKQPSKPEAETQKPLEPKKPDSVNSADTAVLNASNKKQKARAGNKDLRQIALEKEATTTKVENKAAKATAVAPKEADVSRTSSPTPSKKQYEHLLLPSLPETLKLPENPTLLQQLARLFYSSKENDLKHLHLVKDPPRIKNALVIGVHGYFPAPLIQSVLGRPTGTSIKFADMAAKAIKRYTRTHGYECSVKTAALEGEGKIAERIDLLWKLLLNWIDDIRKADFVFISAHSQGVPVAIMLLAKLIHFGCVSGARVGICAMAGVNMGPFPEYKSRWISGSSAGELFEFADSSSKVSRDYLAALDDVLKFGTRLTYVGSIDDQLVSMESSIFAPVSHPHIFRAVSIDSRLQAPDFVSHLVAFVLKLRNLGIQDHGLIRELSTPLAGSLYTGEGHSRLYEDDAIYDLALSFALETTSMTGTSVTRRDTDTAGTNPYILPFAMRGILEEDFVKSELQAEAQKLLSQFDDWRPQTKALKDVKFRLEGIRSKL